MKGVLLGPQQMKNTLGEAVKSLGVKGPIATVTAGWQERESQDDELAGQLGCETINLNLYKRAEEVFASDDEYAKAHRARQDNLRMRQGFYAMRLERTFQAAVDIDRRVKGTELEAEEQIRSFEAVRTLDKEHLKRCIELREEFEAQVKPFERPSIAKHREELRGILKNVGCIAIAGGHVAVLLNRLRMFGIAELLTADHALIAWSGGAMVTGDRVVLFHESPPQGFGISEVMDPGLSLHSGVLCLPNPRLRLKLDDAFRVSWFARRNKPEKLIAFDQGDRVQFEKSAKVGTRGKLEPAICRWFDPHGTQWLKSDGSVSSDWTGSEVSA